MEKIEALNFIMNMTNNDTLNAAAGSPAKSKPSGTFRFFMNAQNAGQSENSKSAPDATGFMMLKILAKQGFDGKLKITDIGSENDEEDSMCGDSGLQDLVDGIVGILEGFGLLDYNMDESAIDQISDFIASISDGSGMNNADYAEALSQIIARMPNAEQFAPFMQEAEDAVKQLLGEYQCSFDNTNNSGVEEAGLEGEAGSQEASASADRVKVMLKIAIDKSGGLKVRQIGLPNGKAAEKFESENGADNSNGSALAFEQTPGALKTERYQTDKNMEQVAKNDMAENVSRIAEKITSRQMEGKREFEVKLKPEFLGKLSIKLVMDGEGIKAHIKAADQYVKGLISEQLPELSQALKDKGVNMSNIEVVYDNPMFSSTDQQFHGQRQNMGTGKGMSSYAFDENDIESVSFIDAMDQTDLFLKNGSVEFSA